MQIHDLIRDLEVISAALARLIGAAQAMADSQPFGGRSSRSEPSPEDLPGIVDLKLNTDNAGQGGIIPKEKKNSMFTFKDGKWRKRPNGSYEVRFRQFGINKSFCRTTYEEAEKEFRKFITQLNKTFKKPTERPSGVTVADWLKVFLEQYKKPFVCEKAFENLARISKRYIEEPFGARRLNSLEALEVQTYLIGIVNEGKGRTAEDVKTLFKGLFETALSNGKIKNNVMTAVKIPKHYRLNGSALTLAEENALVRALNGSAYRAVILFCLYSGCRRSEALSLRSSDIDLDANTITIETAKVKNKNRKARITRTVPIFPKLRAVLEDLPETEYPLAVATADKITHEFKKLMPDHHLHDLRHTFTTRARECGIDNELVSLWTGHAFAGNTTATVYTHFSMTFQQKEAEKLRY